MKLNVSIKEDLSLGPAEQLCFAAQTATFVGVGQQEYLGECATASQDCSAAIQPCNIVCTH